LGALSAVPKSGEVWCEGARTHLNPLLCENFDLGTAQQYLNFAIQFTPQYGDSFIEYLRLEIMTQVTLVVHFSTRNTITYIP
jgi:la-related protein 1